MAPGSRGEQRLDVERLAGVDHEMDAVPGNVDARHLVDDGIHLRDHDAALERRRLHHGRRVLGVGTGVEIAVAIGADGRDEGDMRRQVDEIAREKLEIGVHRSELDLAAEQHARDAGRLRARIGVVEPPGDTRLEDVEMFGQDDARLHHMQPMHLAAIDAGQGGREKVGLFLVVAFQTDAIARAYDGLQQRGRIGAIDELAGGERGGGPDPLAVCRLFAPPVGHAHRHPSLPLSRMHNGI